MRSDIRLAPCGIALRAVWEANIRQASRDGGICCRNSHSCSWDCSSHICLIHFSLSSSAARTFQAYLHKKKQPSGRVAVSFCNICVGFDPQMTRHFPAGFMGRLSRGAPVQKDK